MSPNDQCQNKIDYILCRWKWRSCIWSAKTRPGADCGSDHQLLTAKFRLKLKRVGKTTRPARYDLHQIPYEYAVEVTNRFKGLDLGNSVPEGLWTKVHNIAQDAANKTIPKKKKQEGKEVIWGGFTNSWRKKWKYIQLNTEFQRITRRDKKAFFNEQCIKIRGKQLKGKD